MIRYALKCADDHHFEMWFKDSATFNSLVENAMVQCPDCGSADVEKTLMAPAVPQRQNPETKQPSPREIAQTIKAYRSKVFEETTDVGRRFPEEAREMHNGDAEQRPIRGEATPDEARALHEDGVQILPVPPEPPKEN